MTAKATQSPPTRAKATTPRKSKPAEELELRRWTPEEVVAKKLLPYTSVRWLREKCYKRQVQHHNDGGRITFTAEDIRAENERTAVVPEQRTRAA